MTKRIIALVAACALATVATGTLGAQTSKAHRAPTTNNVYKVSGFDFTGGTFDKTLESQSDLTLNDLKDLADHYVAGHSQGGLNSLGYIKKEKTYADSLKRASRVKGFVAVDSPVRGFAGLDYGYATMRSRVLGALDTHTRAVSSMISVIPFVDVVGTLFNILPVTARMNVILTVAEWIGGFEGKALVDNIVNQSSPTAAIAEITDMGRLSAYVGKYVGPTTITKVKYQSGTKTYLAIQWRTGLFGIKYPVIVTVSEPVYSYYDRYDYTANFRNDIPIGAVVGTDNDMLSMVKDDPATSSNEASDARTLKTVLQVGYYAAGAIHTTSAVLTFPFGTAYYANHASNCFQGGDWLSNYISRWGDLIGGQTSDAFISVASQTLPGTDKALIISKKIDHAGSTDDPDIWGPDGKVDQIVGKMKTLAK